mmetsp:Transcript_8688/g.36213  ORF Transcript_8688/g.36213 Transcript_8688/m.36213 type:complete len:211 (-) Transcript_8688:43-675(-)
MANPEDAWEPHIHCIGVGHVGSTRGGAGCGSDVEASREALGVALVEEHVRVGHSSDVHGVLLGDQESALHISVDCHVERPLLARPQVTVLAHHRRLSSVVESLQIVGRHHGTADAGCTACGGAVGLRGRDACPIAVVDEEVGHAPRTHEVCARHEVVVVVVDESCEEHRLVGEDLLHECHRVLRRENGRRRALANCKRCTSHTEDSRTER